jgi:hypothetical protein
LILEVQGPLSDSFYQADKAIKNNELALRDGGTLVLCAPCRHGIGQDHFVDLLDQAPTYEQARDLVARRGYRLGDHKAVRLRELTDPAAAGCRLHAVSPGLSADQCRRLGAAKSDSPRAALQAEGIDPTRHRVYRVQDAANTVLRIDEKAPGG